MSKSLLLILWPNKFREFDWLRFELSLIEKEYNADIKIHDMSSVMFSDPRKVFPGALKDNRIAEYNSFKKWKKDFRKILKVYNSKLLVLNFVKIDSFFSFLVNFELKKSKVKVIEHSSTQHPMPKIDTSVPILIRKLFICIRNPKIVKFFLSSKFFKFLGNNLNLFPTYSIKSGSEGFPNHYYKKNIKVIEGNSYDYSMYLNSKKNSFQTIKDDYALFIETPGPLFHGDNIIRGLNMREVFTAENWFPPLTNFFNHLEDLLKLKVKIAPHPKSLHKKFPDYYGNREIIDEKLAVAAGSAKALISRNSAGLSFGVFYKKPIILVISNELKSYDAENNVSNSFAKELGVELLNINEPFDPKKILKSMRFNNLKYEEYKSRYLTSRKDEKPNYKIIGDLLNF